MPKKNAYCKKCGSPIDDKTKKCGGCNKRYFHLSKNIVIWCALFALIIGLTGLNVYQYLESKNKAKEFNNRLEALIETREELVKHGEVCSTVAHFT